MKTTKILSAILAATMLFGMCINVGAAEITSETSKTTVVTYGMEKSFIVTIPESVTIANDEMRMGSASVSATNVIINHDEVLKVSISGNDYVDKWELIDTAEDSNRISYTIRGGNDYSEIISGDAILKVSSGEAYNSSVSSQIDFYAANAPTKAGTYTDTLTFTVSIVNSIISFTVDGITYRAEDDMTWVDWLDSNYHNGEDFMISGSVPANIQTTNLEAIYINDDIVYSTDKIVANGAYTT